MTFSKEEPHSANKSFKYLIGKTMMIFDLYA